jgi:hypothetical protein
VNGEKKMTIENSAYNSGLVAHGSAIVPAQPGFYVLSFELFVYGEEVCWECRRAPVIAWRVGDSVVLPVTFDLTIPAGDRADILSPDGNVIAPDGKRYLSYGDWWDDMLASVAGKDRRDANGGALNKPLKEESFADMRTASDPVKLEEPLRRQRPRF